MRPALLAIGVAILVAGVAGVLDRGATSQERQFNRWELEAFKRFSDDTGITSKFSSYIAYCMGASGYEFEYRLDDRLCKTGDPIRNSIERCYVPMGPFSRWLQRFEKMLLR